ncbi:unnamed protein product [Cunninghamella echinulata]
MTQTYTELQSHIDQLWKIIEQQEKQIQELKKIIKNAISNQNGIDHVNPILPTRSPYRSSNTNETDLNSPKDINNNSFTKLPAIGTSTLDTSTTTSLSISQGPVSPIIIEHDAKLFAQYQSAVLKRDIIENKLQKQPTSPITLVPSKSSTLPSQTRNSRIVNRKQHNSMVFPSSIIIPTNNKKEDTYPTTHSLDHSSSRRSGFNAIQEHLTIC